MEVVYATQASNRHLTVVLVNANEWQMLEGKVHRQSLANRWKPLAFRFEAVGKAAVEIPTICTAYLSGLLTFRADLRDKLFPAACDQLEFLPITVDRDDWLLLNCLKTTTGYDAHESLMARGEAGDVFMIQHVVITDGSVRKCGAFTIADSNRAQLLTLASVKDRVRHSGAKGIEFREIGILKTSASAQAQGTVP
jgi:hypothetical protein